MARTETPALLTRHGPGLRSRVGIVRLALFGSRAREQSRADSDIDVPVRFDGPTSSARHFGVQFCLDELLGGPGDPVTTEAPGPARAAAFPAKGCGPRPSPRRRGNGGSMSKRRGSSATRCLSSRSGQTACRLRLTQRVGTRCCAASNSWARPPPTCLQGCTPRRPRCRSAWSLFSAARQVLTLCLHSPLEAEIGSRNP
jgi:uncharacterized protein